MRLAKHGMTSCLSVKINRYSLSKEIYLVKLKFNMQYSMIIFVNRVLFVITNLIWNHKMFEGCPGQ